MVNATACPVGALAATNVAVNAVGPMVTVMVSSISNTSTTKNSAFYNPNTGVAQLTAPRTFNSSSVGNAWLPCSFVGPVGLCGLTYESYMRNNIANGTETVAALNVGCALLQKGVAVGRGGDVQVAAQTVLANPSGTALPHLGFGFAVAIAEISAGLEYHVFIGTLNEHQVHVLNVQQECGVRLGGADRRGPRHAPQAV